jgi:hypothetical protein
MFEKKENCQIINALGTEHLLQGDKYFFGDNLSKFKLLE